MEKKVDVKHTLRDIIWALVGALFMSIFMGYKDIAILIAIIILAIAYFLYKLEKGV